ncbi:hypothetical protein C8Q77DRAFT_1082376 [Trametes polyzona]|nr:hypothetical protein C8Q77DRAFT_1082376 [Trametes polyzona]
MHHHVSLTATLPSLSLASLFQAAAGRAWARTRPTRAYHRTAVRPEGAAPTILHTVQRGHDDGGGAGQSSSSTPHTSYAAPSPWHDNKMRVQPSLPHFSASPSPPQAVDVPCGPEADAVQASSRPSFSRASKRNLVTPITAERLSPRDFEAASSIPSGPSAYESDPPWEEIRDSVPESLLPRVCSRRLPTPKVLSSIPCPSTPDELLANLALAVSENSLPPIGPLLAYHAAYATLHSTASFNLLIRLAIRHASFGTVEKLLGHMVQEGIAGDVETRALRVRCMVRSGRWHLAWREEMVRMKADGLAMPLPVWMEFFGGVKQGAIMLRPERQAREKTDRKVALPAPDPSVAAARLEALLQYPPLLAPGQMERVPSNAVYALVRSLITLGRRPTAVAITNQHFQTLPKAIDEDQLRSCLAIIHLHLRPGPKAKLTEHYAIRGTLLGFLRMHPSFRPTSRTLFFLLASLRRTTECGRRAQELVDLFTKRWGPDVADDAVRRRLASFWLKQGNPRRAKAVVEAQDRLDEERVAWRAEKDAVVGDLMKDRVRRLRWLDLHRSPRRRKESWRWRLLRRRLWRKTEVRRP